MNELIIRREYSRNRIQELRNLLSVANSLVADKACVYATGSFGRGEASPHSDLDLFIVGRKDGKENSFGFEGSQLRRLDEICIKADLIDATRKLHISDFDGDGQYLRHYSAHEFTKTLGKPEDDVTNTFTARLLLLLESYPLLDQGVYQDVIEDVIAAYWRDYEDHKNEFIPAFLANDILRLWRTFCVNYEARTETDPIEKKIKRKIKNYKLKYSRLLTCYSALLYLLGIHRSNGTVSPADALAMTKLTPTQRLEWLLEAQFLTENKERIQKLLEQYEDFLEKTSVNEERLVSIFSDKKEAAIFMSGAYDFGDTTFEVLNIIGDNSRFHRLLSV